jgi:hypothetical protein|uniref:eCIS core domain-containing protein n=3 Tax=Algoriphagus sp. TaxID=1872435 RepID=UPI0040482D59
MGEFSSQADQKNKTVTPAPVPEEISSTGELEYVDTRASTAQLISLQAAADGRGNRSNTTQLQTKALSYAGNSRIAQLQALSDSRTTTAKTNPIQRQENKTGLPDQLKTGMESISGLSLSDVKVHRNSDKPAQLQAHAYAQGTDIHLGPGQEKHLPHELGHVVQQKQGRVKPTMQLKGKVNINDNAGLEKEADVLGAKALQAKFIAPDSLANQTALPSSTQPYQFVGSAEAQWNRVGDRGTEKSARQAPVPTFILGADNVNEFVKSVEDYLALINKIDFADLKKERANKETLQALQQAGATLGAAAIGVGVAATITAFIVTPLAPLGLLVAGIGLGVVKAGVKAAADGKRAGGTEAAVSGVSAGVEAGVAVASEAAAGGVGGGGVLLGAKGFGGEIKTIVKLRADQVAAKAELTKMSNGMQAIEDQLGSKAFQDSLTDFDGVMNAKLAAALTNIQAIKAKILDVDKSIALGTEQTIKSEQVSL